MGVALLAGVAVAVLGSPGARPRGSWSERHWELGKGSPTAKAIVSADSARRRRAGKCAESGLSPGGGSLAAGLYKAHQSQRENPQNMGMSLPQVSPLPVAASRWSIGFCGHQLQPAGTSCHLQNSGDDVA